MTASSSCTAAFVHTPRRTKRSGQRGPHRALPKWRTTSPSLPKSDYFRNKIMLRRLLFILLLGAAANERPVFCSDRSPAGGSRVARSGAGTRLCVDSGILPVERRRLCLGSGRLGGSTVARSEMDPAPLGPSARRLGIRGWILAVSTEAREHSPLTHASSSRATCCHLPAGQLEGRHTRRDRSHPKGLRRQMV